ncbi:uncharacterized protein [Lepeophtheirus salmonis]|nr:uncharacterized protein LOC121132508 [Lepeophtheirus salmonis]XP_040583859.1 uncharacterized protein LOC121132508 [Lepeophtheirus salmonis]XP_040583860.1 uncharacterized protein LOC121132508 [Lepeophtheirus salmonis]
MMTVRVDGMIYFWCTLCISFLAVLGISHATKDLCSKSFCKCPEAAKIVFCECENELKKLDIIEGSLPKQTESLSISQCGEVVLNTNAFKVNSGLKNLKLQNLNRLDLHKNFFSLKETLYLEMNNFTLISIGELQTQTGSFRYFPKVSRVLIQEVGIRKVPEEGLEILTDHFILNDNNIGVLERSSLYSDASNLTIIHNRIERIESGAFDASVRYFNFIENTIDKVLNNGISVAFQEGIISKNIFTTQEGSPFRDVGPDPSCTADPESDYDGDDQIIYNIVANPVLHFSQNTFLNFSDELLNFPGANNVPLGSLHIDKNIFKCDCESLMNFAILVDFDYVYSLSRLLMSRETMFLGRKSTIQAFA